MNLICWEGILHTISSVGVRVLMKFITMVTEEHVATTSPRRLLSKVLKCVCASQTHLSASQCLATAAFPLHQSVTVISSMLIKANYIETGRHNSFLIMTDRCCVCGADNVMPIKKKKKKERRGS